MSAFCHKCGKGSEMGDQFCQSCGAQVTQEKTVRKSHNPKRVELEKKAWFRGIKVLYIVAIGIAILAIGGASLSSKPTRNLDGEKSSIACNNGKFYAPAKNSIWVIGENLDSTDDEHARILCKYDTLAFYSHSEYIEKNYTFNPAYKDSEYGSWMGYTVLAFFILWVLSYLVKIGFFYIAIGEKPEIKLGNYN